VDSGVGAGGGRVKSQRYRGLAGWAGKLGRVAYSVRSERASVWVGGGDGGWVHLIDSVMVVWMKLV
jgi:hypothetical protein